MCKVLMEEGAGEEGDKEACPRGLHSGATPHPQRRGVHPQVLRVGTKAVPSAGSV